MRKNRVFVLLITRDRVKFTISISFEKEEIIMNRVWKSLIAEENIVKWRRHFHKYPNYRFMRKKLHNLYMIHYAHFLLLK